MDAYAINLARLAVAAASFIICAYALWKYRRNNRQ